MAGPLSARRRGHRGSVHRHPNQAAQRQCLPDVHDPGAGRPGGRAETSRERPIDSIRVRAAVRCCASQALLPGAAPPVLEGRAVGSTPGPGEGSAGAADPRKMVRTDNRTRTLDAFLTHTSPSVPPTATEHPPAEGGQGAPPKRPRVGAALTTEREAVASHLEELQREVVQAVHPGLQTLFREHFFVGCVSDTLALVQHQTRLCLVNVQAVGCAACTWLPPRCRSSMAERSTPVRRAGVRRGPAARRSSTKRSWDRWGGWAGCACRSPRRCAPSCAPRSTCRRPAGRPTTATRTSWPT